MMKMSRRRATVFVTATLLAGSTLSACGGDSGSRSGADELNLVTFNSAVYFVDTVALHKGFFKDHGLSVRFVKPQAGASAYQLMLSGEVAGLISDQSLAQQVIAKGQQAQVIGSAFNQSAWTIFSTQELADSAADAFPDKLHALRGKTIGVTGIGAASDIALRAVLVSAGMDPDKDVTIIGVGEEQAAAAQMKAGKLGAFVNVPPAGSFLQSNGAGVPFFEFADEAPANIASIPEGVVVTSKKWLDQHGELADEWLGAYEDAIEWVKEPANKDEASMLFAKHQGGTEDEAGALIDFLVNDVYANLNDGLKVSENAWLNNTEVLMDTGVLTKNETVDYDSSVPEFARTD